MSDGAQNIRSSPAGGDADHHVAEIESEIVQVPFRVLGMILRPFDRLRQRLRAAGDQADDLSGR